MNLGLVQGRDFSLSFDRAVIFQTEIVFTGREGWDVTPALFGPTVLVGGRAPDGSKGHSHSYRSEAVNSSGNNFPIPLVPPRPLEVPGGCFGGMRSVSS